MIPISSALSGGLTFARLPRCQDYELRLNHEVVGSLRKPSFWSSDYIVETSDGRWTFRRGGFCGTGAEIVDSKTGLSIAKFKSSWGGRGELAFTDGQIFQVEYKGWWRPVWSVLTETRRPVLHIHQREHIVKLEPGVRISESRLALLIFFAWYRMLREQEDAAAAVMVAAVS